MRHGTGERPAQPGVIINLESMPDGVCSVMVGDRTYKFYVDFSVKDPYHVMVTAEGKDMSFVQNAQGGIEMTSYGNKTHVHDALIDAARKVARTIFELSPDEKIRLAPQPPKTQGQDGHARFKQAEQTPRAANEQF